MTKPLRYFKIERKVIVSCLGCFNDGEKGLYEGPSVRKGREVSETHSETHVDHMVIMSVLEEYLFHVEKS